MKSYIISSNLVNYDLTVEARNLEKTLIKMILVNAVHIHK